MRDGKEVRIQKKTLIVGGAILAAVVLIIALWSYVLNGSPQSTDDTKNTPDQSQTKKEQDDIPSAEEDGDSDTEIGGDTDPVPDPALFSSVTIAPAGVEVYYSKGTPGFNYHILRTPSGTSYIEFSAESLVGTKCTDDAGVFVSIIKNPTASEESTVTATTKVGLDTYGLSLASATCTGDTTLLSQYQAAFKNGFGSLRESPKVDN